MAAAAAAGKVFLGRLRCPEDEGGAREAARKVGGGASSLEAPMPAAADVPAATEPGGAGWARPRREPASGGRAGQRGGWWEGKEEGGGGIKGGGRKEAEEE